MEPLLSLNEGIPSEFNGHFNSNYEEIIRPVQATSQHHHNVTYRKKSKVRLNDQVIPKPTDINIGGKMLSIPTPKEHPYSSHISRFALFPSICSPDDPHTGVRAASQPFPNTFIPGGPLDATVLSKTIGGAYRHELLEMGAQNVMWPGEHGLLDYTKPPKEKKQVFYPAPRKTVLPNSKLRNWDLTLPERTSSALRNMEQALWVTSYQLQYAGSRTANPLQTGDFKERMSGLAEKNTYRAPLREHSYPMTVPFKPKHECRRRQESLGQSTGSPRPGELLNLSPARMHQHRPREITDKRNEAPHLDPQHRSQSVNNSGSTQAASEEVTREMLHKQQNKDNSSTYGSRERARYKVHFAKSPTQMSESQSRKQANTQQPRKPLSSQDPQGETDINREPSKTQRVSHKVTRGFKSSHSQSAVAKDTAGTDLTSGLLSRAAAEQEKPAASRNTSCSLLQRSRVLPGIHPVDRAGTVGRGGAALRLLDLQRSFSRSAAHRNFNSSITHAAVDLRDNVAAGKRHNFFGFNCYYLHG